MNCFIEKDGKMLPYKITYKHNKHTYYRVKQSYVDVSASKQYPKKLIHSFLTTHFQHFYELLNAQDIERDDEIMLWNKRYELRVMTGNFRYHIKDHIVYVYTRTDIVKTKKRIYHDHIKLKTNEIQQTMEPVLNQADIHLIPLKYKYLKSKFGSYHRRHDEITINTFLARLDPIFLTYVLYHEYAHTKVFNHSSRFYQLLDQLMPGYKSIQKRLKNVVII